MFLKNYLFFVYLVLAVLGLLLLHGLFLSQGERVRPQIWASSLVSSPGERVRPRVGAGGLVSSRGEWSALESGGADPPSSRVCRLLTAVASLVASLL